MVGKNNFHLKKRKLSDKQQKYAIRRFKVGVASALIGTGLFFTMSPVTAQENGEITQQDSAVKNISDITDITGDFNDTSSIVPDSTNNETLNQPTVENVSVKEAPIEEGHIRLHFTDLPEEKIENLGLWTWGGVESESKNWPTGATLFSKEKKDEYGYYLDVAQSSNPADIGFLVVDTTGTSDDSIKLTKENQAVKLVSKEMNESWLDGDFNSYAYQPIKNENLLRINYFREDGNYDNLGLWIWNDVENASTNWPTGAILFEKEGKYGRYIDVPLTKGLNSSIGFLVVNTKEGSKPIDNLTFSDRKNHSQIFIRNDEQQIYTNPYYVKQNSINPETATSGTQNIKVSASVNREVTSNQFSLLDVKIDKPADTEIAKIIADVSALGMSKEVVISPELNRVAITSTHDIPAGKYQIPVKVYDTNNGYYETITEVMVKEHDKAAFAWDEQIIYFMLTDRFNDGNPSNNNPYNMPYETAGNKGGVYRGGDFKGITDKLDYLADLGVTTIWITPIVENIKYDTSGNKYGSEFYGYHGYWASNFEELNPHLGTLEEFHQLIDAAANKKINIMVDVVLNHPGYGMRVGEEISLKGAPTAQEQARFAGLIRKEDGLDADTQRGLSGLPDFETENHKVREQLVAWQADWLRKATTPNGNSIYGFRVDTVTNVEDTTWQHFKNVLIEHNPKFHLIGESWGANYKNTNNDLGSGKFDSLLDFGFKEIAKKFVSGDLVAAQEELIARNNFLTSAATLGQFLSSHDEDGFLHNLGGDVNKQKIAATLQLTAKGQPVIYYGEEIGHTGANNWPVYDNRYLFDWDNVENNELHHHYSKLLEFRHNYSKLLSRGERSTVAGSNDQKWLLTKRNNEEQAVYVLTSLNEKDKSLAIEVDSLSTVIKDHYFNQTYHAEQDESGKFIVKIDAPKLSDGGTLLLSTVDGNIVTASEQGITQDVKIDNPIEEGAVRIHFKKLPNQPINTLGLWIWGDVETASENKGTWPNGATKFSEAIEDDYGYYLDIRKSGSDASKINYLINNTKGDNITGDRSIPLISSSVNEVWIDEALNVYYYRPLDKPKTIRINYYRKDGNYDNLGVWTWDSSQTPGINWPDGINLENEGKYGRYVDVPLKDLEQLGFLIVNEKTQEKTQQADYIFKDLANHSQIFIRNNDAKIYTNPHFVSHLKMEHVEQISDKEIEIIFSSVDGLSMEYLSTELSVTKNDNQKIQIEKIVMDQNKVKIKGDFNYQSAPYTIHYENTSLQTRIGWHLKDELYGYDGPLGAELNNEGTVANMNLWAPSAEAVEVIVYDKDNNKNEVGRVALNKGEKGVWNLSLDAKKDLSIDNLINYVYHYEIKRDNKTYLVLDPYAKSMAAWDSSDNGDIPDGISSKRVGKAAFVLPNQLGPELSYANIDGFERREDAIIYEAHVRDFTSDPNIANELTAQFGTFAAFIERLDYLKDLGVTHIQLLPVMNYYYVNELKNGERLLDYTSSNSNYNWGYDPQNYFSLTGMYSQEPTNPSKRIEEFKTLVNEIHKRGMGVILDVVYNHTASLHILEDIEPNYYHFMTANGTAKESFGGGRLGTTHKMSRRILVDSIKYLVNEFKVDGFRFDMMGDHDAESIKIAFEEAKALNPNIIMLGEGWVTFAGDDHHSVQPADQTWMRHTDTVSSFSDEIRNELKSGFGSEGQPRFLTNGARNIKLLFNNIIGRPSNFVADDPGDVVQYIAAHDNLTLYDVIAQSIKKDPKYHNEEILKRIRLGNSIILTSQGTPFIHSGQEYGRTKQFLHPDYQTIVSSDLVPNKATYMVDEQGKPFEYPYFIHDSYDSSDAVNRFDWEKAMNKEKYADHVLTREYTKGLIAIRRSTDAFSRDTMEEIDQNVSLITSSSSDDLLIGYQAIASNGDIYAVFVNADMNERHVTLGEKYQHLLEAKVIADAKQAGTLAIENPEGVVFTTDGIKLEGLTSAILLIKKADEEIPEDKNDPTVIEEDKKDEQSGNSDTKEQTGSGDGSEKDKTEDNSSDTVEPDKNPVEESGTDPSTSDSTTDHSEVNPPEEEPSDTIESDKNSAEESETDPSTSDSTTDHSEVNPPEEESSDTVEPDKNPTDINTIEKTEIFENQLKEEGVENRNNQQLVIQSMSNDTSVTLSRLVTDLTKEPLNQFTSLLEKMIKLLLSNQREKLLALVNEHSFFELLLKALNRFIDDQSEQNVLGLNLELETYLKIFDLNNIKTDSNQKLNAMEDIDIKKAKDLLNEMKALLDPSLPSVDVESLVKLIKEMSLLTEE